MISFSFIPPIFGRVPSFSLLSVARGGLVHFTQVTQGGGAHLTLLLKLREDFLGAHGSLGRHGSSSHHLDRG